MVDTVSHATWPWVGRPQVLSGDLRRLVCKTTVICEGLGRRGAGSEPPILEARARAAVAFWTADFCWRKAGNRSGIDLRWPFAQAIGLKATAAATARVSVSTPASRQRCFA